MLTPRRALSLHADAGRELPRIPALHDVYGIGVKFRHGQVMMIVGRSGSQKSGLALFLAAQWNVPTLYFSADMSPSTASTRLASMVTSTDGDAVEAAMQRGGHDAAFYMNNLEDLHITFSFGAPITWSAVDQEMDAFIELWDAYPELIIFDNLMDFDGAEADYSEQMNVMANATELARATSSAVMLLHHATDKSWDAKSDPWMPPSRDQVKGGLSEKPELSISVGLDPTSNDFRMACVKQRSGPSNPTAQNYVTLRAKPELTQFERATYEGRFSR